MLKILIASVVPNAITTYQFFAKKYFKMEPMIINIGDKLKLPFTFSEECNPTGFGADRIIDIVEALKVYPDRNLIIFDLELQQLMKFLKKVFMSVEEFYLE